MIWANLESLLKSAKFCLLHLKPITVIRITAWDLVIVVVVGRMRFCESGDEKCFTKRSQEVYQHDYVKPVTL